MSVVATVSEIVADVRERGDEALREWAVRLDGAEPARATPAPGLPEDAVQALAGGRGWLLCGRHARCGEHGRQGQRRGWPTYKKTAHQNSFVPPITARIVHIGSIAAAR